jgi:hypothetical protein
MNRCLSHRGEIHFYTRYRSKDAFAYRPIEMLPAQQTRVLYLSTPIFSPQEIQVLQLQAPESLYSILLVTHGFPTVPSQ